MSKNIEASIRQNFYDIRLLSRENSFLLSSLRLAVVGTLRRRGHEGTVKKPALLNPEHPAVEPKQIQWSAFVRKNQISNVPEDFKQVCAEIHRFLAPVFPPDTQVSDMQWTPSVGWTPVDKALQTSV